MTFCTHTEDYVDFADEHTVVHCDADAVVEIKALDPEDPSSGRFCMDHARTFLNAPTAAEWATLTTLLATLEPRAAAKDAEDFWMALTEQEQDFAVEAVSALKGYDYVASRERLHAKGHLGLSLRVAQTVRPRDYESAEVSLYLNDLTLATTDEEIDALIEKGHVQVAKLAERVGKRAKEARDRGGW